MPRDTLPRIGRFGSVLVVGALVALSLLVFTGSPAWGVVFLIVVVVSALLWPKEQIRYNLAWRDRGVPLQSWPYWLLSGIGYLALVGMIGALVVGAWGFGWACFVTGMVTTVAANVLFGVHVKRSLRLPRPPALSPHHRRIVVVSCVAFAVGVLGLLLEQYVLALVVGVPAAVSLIALAWLTIRRGRRLLDEAIRKSSRVVKASGASQQRTRVRRMRLAEQLIDCEEDRTLRAVPLGCCGR